jgi:hypothetical protein
MTTSWEMQMAKQRDAEKKVKDAEKKKEEEEAARKAEEDAKFGNKLKAGFSNMGQGIKVGQCRLLGSFDSVLWQGAFVKTDQKISQSVDGKHKSNGGVPPRDGDKSPRNTGTSPRK